MKLHLRQWCLWTLMWWAGASAASTWELDAVPRVVAISDIHGANDTFVATLRAARVVDASQAWSGGKTHLVVVGDIVDRGNDSRRTMDLLMRLEDEAMRAGGAVHVVLGNHELMNLVGDLRYASRAEYAAFAADETPALREAAFTRYLAARPSPPPPADTARHNFDEQFPPGFFAHRAAFARTGKYGAWLLGKPLALRVGDTLYVHAGISQAMAALGLAGINVRLRNELAEYLRLQQEFIDAGRIDTMVDFYDIPDRLAPFRAGGTAPTQDTRESERIEQFLALHESVIHSLESPLWYRGNYACGALVESSRLDATLDAFHVQRVVIGHTPTWQRRIWSRLDGKVVTIDAGMLHAYYGGQGAALIVEGEGLTAIYEGAEAATPVAAQPQGAGTLSPELSPDDLEAALREGQVLSRTTGSDGDPVSLQWRGSKLQARFIPAKGKERFLPELAAYRLDRMLSLEMVPTVVERTIDGVPGTLQYLPPGLVTETERTADHVRIDPWCPLADQFLAMYIFDALLYNEQRTPDRILYSRSNGGLVLLGHAGSFGTRGGIPPHLKNVTLTLNRLWQRKLETLANEPARSKLEDVLGGKRLKALLKRAEALNDGN